MTKWTVTVKADKDPEDSRSIFSRYKIFEDPCEGIEWGRALASTLCNSYFLIAYCENFNMILPREENVVLSMVDTIPTINNQE